MQLSQVKINQTEPAAASSRIFADLMTGARAEPDLAQPAVSRFCHFVRSTIFSMEVVYIVAVVAMLLFGALGIWVLSPSNDGIGVHAKGTKAHIRRCECCLCV